MTRKIDKPKPIRPGDRFRLGDGRIWKVTQSLFGRVGLHCEERPAYIELQTSVVRERERISP